MLDALDQAAAAGRRAAPDFQPRDHVASHAGRGLQTGGGPAPGPGRRHVGGVGLGDAGPDAVVFQPRGEGFEEGGDRQVRDRAHLLERGVGAADRLLGDRLGGRRHVQQVARPVDHDQPVAGGEARGEVFGHQGEPISAEGDRHAGGQPFQDASAHGRRLWHIPRRWGSSLTRRA